MKIRILEPTNVICPTCNGLGFVKSSTWEELCPTCSGSGEVIEELCVFCGEREENCSCFPAEDLPVWCQLDPHRQECPADEKQVQEAVETLLLFCEGCLYNINQVRKAA